MSSLKKVLWISPFVPYSTVGHASGKTEFFYTDALAHNQDIDFKMITFARYDEKDKIDLDYFPKIVWYEMGIKKIIRNIFDINSLYNPFNKYAGMTPYFIKSNVLKNIRNLKKNGFYPDVIILQWTQVVLLIDKIKKIFPNSKIFCLEEDVSYLSYQRKYENAKNPFRKISLKLRYDRLKKIEIDSLSLADIAFINNDKDKKLLMKDSSKKINIKRYNVYYDKFTFDDKIEKEYVLFYGALNREENYLTVNYIIDNIVPHFPNEKFVFLGNKPPKFLVDKGNKLKNVFFTGFVSDVSEYFSKSKCLLCPLVLGAGIKVKVLECMNACIPVFGNNIAMEGIPARDNESYINIEDGTSIISKLEFYFKNNNLLYQIGQNGKEVIESNFNYDKTLNEIIEYINN